MKFTAKSGNVATIELKAERGMIQHVDVAWACSSSRCDQDECNAWYANRPGIAQVLAVDADAPSEFKRAIVDYLLYGG